MSTSLVATRTIQHNSVLPEAHLVLHEMMEVQLSSVDTHYLLLYIMETLSISILLPQDDA